MANAPLDYRHPEPPRPRSHRLARLIFIGIIFGFIACTLLTLVYYHTAGLAPE
jgi:hypothetical protein